MSLRRFLTGASLMLGLVFITGTDTFGQQPTPLPQDNGQQQQRHERRGGRRQGMGKRGHGGGIRRLMNQLNLTDAQEQQMRAIFERFEASTRIEREELRRLHDSTQGEPSAETRARFQALRSKLDQARQSQHEELLNVLTTEQRAQLEQLLRERKARFGEGRGRRMNQQQNEDDQ
jgi:Spy/CpxP family protein refolding chaperone